MIAQQPALGRTQLWSKCEASTCNQEVRQWMMEQSTQRSSAIHALKDSDVQMRRNAELVLIALAGGYDGEPKMDIRGAIPALIKATGDKDSNVRQWAAHALAEIGPDAKDAVPALIKLLKDSDEGPRNDSCMALGDIGPAAIDALPALRNALNDSSKDVRQFAQQAIDKIQNK